MLLYQFWRLCTSFEKILFKQKYIFSNIMGNPPNTKKKLKLPTPETTSHPSNLNFIGNTEVVIQLRRLSESVVAEMTAGGSALSPGQTKKKLKLSTPETTSLLSNLNFIGNNEVVIQLERLSESVVAEMTSGGTALPPGQTKKNLKLSTPETTSLLSNLNFIGNNEVVIQLERLSESVVAEMTSGGTALPPGQTKKNLKLSTPETTSLLSNLNFIGNTEVVIQLERLSDSVVAEMTSGGTALPPGQTKKNLKLSTPETTSLLSNLNFIGNTEVVIQLERLSESVVAEMTSGGTALPPGQTKKKLKLSTPEATSHPSNPNFICNTELVIQLERLSQSVVAKMTAVGSSLPPEQTKKKLNLSAPKTKLHPSNSHFICDKEAVIQLERLSKSVVAKMTAVGSSLPPEQTKKKLKLSAPKTKLHPSNSQFICDKEVVIQLERLSESVVAKMTAVGSSLPPEQTKKKFKLSAPKTKLHASNPHFICDKELVIQLERLSESVVAKMTAVGSSLPPEQTKKKFKLSAPKTKLHASNPHFICDKELVIQLERLSESVVAKMTAVGSSLPPGQTKKNLNLSAPKTKLHPSNSHFICDKEAVIQLERLSQSVVAKMTAVGSSLPPEQTKKKLNLSAPKTKLHLSNSHFICDKEAVIKLERLSESVVAKMTAVGSSLPPEQVNETNEDALGINSLPDEIILKVFSNLTQNQLGQMARVCRRWNALAKSPGLWRKVNVKIFSSDRPKKVVTKSFINRLPSFVTFIRLDFSEFVFYRMDFEQLCVKLHQNCPHVEELILINLRMSNLLPEVINFCTHFLQCLKKLVFDECTFYHYSRTVELNDNSKIEVLDLCSCDISPFSKTQFSKLLYLKELRLSFTDVDDTWFVDDTSFFDQLLVLDVGWTLITASTFLAIQRHGHNMKELYLCYCSLKDHHLNFTDSAFPHLKTICLGLSSVTCEGVVSLIQSCPSLENIYVIQRVSESFAEHPFVLANRCKSGIVKAIHSYHNHNVDYSHN